MFVCCQDEKRAALRDLESAQLKELAEKHGLSNDKALPEKSTEVYELQWFCICATRPLVLHLADRPMPCTVVIHYWLFIIKSVHRSGA